MESSFENYLAHSDDAASFFSSRGNSRYGAAPAHEHGRDGDDDAGRRKDRRDAGDAYEDAYGDEDEDAIALATDSEDAGSPGAAPLGSWDGYVDHEGLADNAGAATHARPRGLIYGAMGDDEDDDDDVEGDAGLGQSSYLQGGSTFDEDSLDVYSMSRMGGSMGLGSGGRARNSAYGATSAAAQGDAAYEFDFDLKKDPEAEKKKRAEKKKKKQQLKRDKEQERIDRQRRERQRRQSTEERMQDLLGEVKEDFAKEKRAKEAELQAQALAAAREAAAAQARARAEAEAEAEAERSAYEDGPLSDSLEMSSADFQVGGYSSRNVKNALAEVELSSPKAELEHKDHGAESADEDAGRGQSTVDKNAGLASPTTTDKSQETNESAAAAAAAEEEGANGSLDALRQKLSVHMDTGLLPNELAKEISFGDLSQLMQAPPDDEEEETDEEQQDDHRNADAGPGRSDVEEAERIYRSFEEHAKESEPGHNLESANGKDADNDDDADDASYESGDFESESPRDAESLRENVSPGSPADAQEPAVPGQALNDAASGEDASEERQEGSSVRAGKDKDEEAEADGAGHPKNRAASFAEGERIRACLFDWAQHYTGHVSKVRGDGLLDLSFDDGDHVDGVDPADVEALGALLQIAGDASSAQMAQSVVNEDQSRGDEGSDRSPSDEETGPRAPTTKSAANGSPHVDAVSEPDAPVSSLARPATPPSPRPSKTDSSDAALSRAENDSVDAADANEESGDQPAAQRASRSRAEELRAMFWDPLASSQHSPGPPSPPSTPPPPPVALPARAERASGGAYDVRPDGRVQGGRSRVLRREKAAASPAKRRQRRPSSPPPPPPPPSPPYEDPARSSRYTTYDNAGHGGGSGAARESSGLRREVHELQLRLAASEESRQELERALAHAQQRERELETTIDSQKAEIFGLHAELKDTKSTNAVRASLRTVLRDSKETALPREELARIEREMAEQDRLLAGYQKENEKLVAQVRDAEARAEEVRQTIYRANMRTGLDHSQQLGEARQGPQADAEGLRSALAAEEKTRALEEEVEDLKRRLAERDAELKRVTATATKDSAGESARELAQELRKELAEARFEHLREAKSLKEKLAWYVENQQLLEEHAAVIEEQRERIRALEDDKDLDALAQAAARTGSRRPKQSLPSDLKRIRTLEKQVHELEEALRKRNPDCIANLILAAGPTDAEKETRRELRQQVASLKEELESKAKTHASRMRSLRQEHERVKLRYERLLDNNRAWGSDRSSSGPRASEADGAPAMAGGAHSEAKPRGAETSAGAEARIQQLEQELLRVREFYRKKIEDLSKKSSTALRAARREGPVSSAAASAQRDLDRLRAAKTALEARVEDLEAAMSTSKAKSALAGLEARLSSLQEENAALQSELAREQRGSGLQRIRERNEPGQDQEDISQGPEDSPRGSGNPAADPSRPEHDDPDQEDDPTFDEGVDDDDETSALVALLHGRAPGPKSRQGKRGRFASQSASHSGSVRDQITEEARALETKVRALEAENARVETRWTAALERSEDAVRRLRGANAELTARLTEAKRQLDEPATPSMIQQQALTRRLNEMEARFQARERELELIVQNVKHRADMDMHAAQARFEAGLAAKNAEIRHFRTELDALLSAARNLA